MGAKFRSWWQKITQRCQVYRASPPSRGDRTGLCVQYSRKLFLGAAGFHRLRKAGHNGIKSRSTDEDIHPTPFLASTHSGSCADLHSAYLVALSVTGV